MDPLHLCIAVGPLAVYLLLIGMINLVARPFLTTGGRDTAALGVAVLGFVVVGPMELFMPDAAAARFGMYVWLLMLGLYALSLTLLVLLTRPRLVIYNITIDQLRPVLAELVTELDDEARWAGDSLVLPHLDVQLTVESFPGMRNVQLVAAGPVQSYDGWRRLETALAEAMRKTRSSSNPYGVFLVLLSVLMIGVTVFWLIEGADTIRPLFDQMLRR